MQGRLVNADNNISGAQAPLARLVPDGPTAVIETPTESSRKKRNFRVRVIQDIALSTRLTYAENPL